MVIIQSRPGGCLNASKRYEEIQTIERNTRVAKTNEVKDKRLNDRQWNEIVPWCDRLEYYASGDDLQQTTSWGKAKHNRYKSYDQSNTNRSRESGTVEKREPGTLRPHTLLI